MASEEFVITHEIILVLSILVFTMFLFVSNVIRVDVVAVLVLVVIGLTNLLPPEQLFAGFSSEAIISLIAVMIISSGLEKTGISLRVARWIIKIGNEQPTKTSFLLMLASGLFSGFMRSLGTVALFLPVVTRIHARTGISKKYLLMPMAFCAILGGTLTMVGAGPLIVLNSLLKNASMLAHIKESYFFFEPFHLFDVFPIGLLLLATGIVYFFIIHSKISEEVKTGGLTSGSTKVYFKQTYHKGGDIFELKVSKDSPLVGGSLKDMELKLTESLAILAVSDGADMHYPPLRKLIINAGAIIAILGDKDEVVKFARTYRLKLYPKLNIFAEIMHPVRSGLCESVIPPSSQLIGQEVRELHMRRNHRVHVLALYRGNTVYQGDELSSLTLRSGDTLGMYCNWEDLDEFKKHPDFVVFTTAYPRERVYPKKVKQALFFFFLTVILVSSELFPLAVGLLFGAVGMIATGVLKVDEAYESVSWQTVFLLAGLFPLGLTVQTTGTSDWLAYLMIKYGDGLSIWLFQVILALVSTIFSLVISNIGATVLLVPIVIEWAIAMSFDPRMYALIVALAASNTFLIPTHQVNALIAGPGGYQIKDFIKIGSGMTIIYLVVMLFCVNVLFNNI